MGNITKAADNPSGGTGDTQCYTYDGLQRLSSAWTPATGDCTAAASTANLGGAAPYWKSWTFDGTDGVTGTTSNRLTETTHAASGDTTVTSAYTQAGHPHGVSGTTTTVGGTQTATASYTYDADGNTTSRPGASGQQTLTWDAEGKVSTVTAGSSTYSYVYDADGNRLIAHDPTGATLYLNGAQLRLTTATGAKNAERYYTFNGQTVAQRTAGGLQFLANDPNGTSTIAVDDTTAQTTVKRYLDPYGNTAGAATSWVGTKSFVGGDQDPTGLIHEGAREYDPAQGRFISRDPLLDGSDPAQMNGYTYADDNPVVHSDPTGRMLDAAGGGGDYYPVTYNFPVPVRSYNVPAPGSNSARRNAYYDNWNRRYEASKAARSSSSSRSSSHSKSHGWKHFLKKAADFVSDISPVIDLAAIFIPGGAILLGIVVAVDLIAAADGVINGVKETEQNGFDLTAGLDFLGAAASVVGVGGVGMAKVAESQATPAFKAMKAADKYRSEMPRSIRRQTAHAAAGNKLAGHSRMLNGGLLLAATAGEVSDINTLACDDGVTCKDPYASLRS
jgi:RHS repeat-associated protein